MVTFKTMALWGLNDISLEVMRWSTLTYDGISLEANIKHKANNKDSWEWSVDVATMKLDLCSLPLQSADKQRRASLFSSATYISW